MFGSSLSGAINFHLSGSESNKRAIRVLKSESYSRSLKILCLVLQRRNASFSPFSQSFLEKNKDVLVLVGELFQTSPIFFYLKLTLNFA